MSVIESVRVKWNDFLYGKGELTTPDRRPSDIDREFHQRVYHAGSPWMNGTKWLGVGVMKNPCDLLSLQEVIHDTRPEIIIETGTQGGGSALFMATICDAAIYSIDIIPSSERNNPPPSHSRIVYLTGDSVSDEIVSLVMDVSQGKRTMVVLDSDHSYQHVLREMDLYSPLVSPDCYLIVEDTNLNGHPVAGYFGLGPHEAVEEFLRHHPEFERDPLREKYWITFHPGGWLKRLE